MSSIKTLIIAPYEGLKDAISGLLYQYPEIDADIYVADLNDAVTLLEEIDDTSYEVIISRGGTAGLLKSHTSVPVVEISISIYDLLRGIKMAESISSNIAIGGFRIFTENAVVICNLLQYSIPVYTISDRREASACIDEIEGRYGSDTVILCDQIMHFYAKEKGLRSILITSGNESIKEALVQAISEAKSRRKDRLLIGCLTRYLDSKGTRLMIYDHEKHCIYSGEFEEKERNFLEKAIQEVFAFKDKVSADHGSNDRSRSWRQQNGDQLSEVEYQRYTVAEGPADLPEDSPSIHVFSLRSYSRPPALQGSALTSYNYSDLLTRKNARINNNISFSQSFREQLCEAAGSPYPVILVGEPGTGKEQGALYMYENSPRTDRPLYQIDLKLINEKQLRQLFYHESSPLYDRGSTIYLKNVQDCGQDLLSLICTNVLDPAFYRNNKYIFSIIKKSDSANEEAIQSLSNHSDTIHIYFPALRERMVNFNEYCVLYLNEFNNKLGKQVIGLAPNAMDLMKSYRWPYNLDQLKRVLKELVRKADTPYIKYEDVDNLLQAESHKDHTLLAGQFGINTYRPLSEINREIISFVVSQENGNQTKAARRLGISRGTIWRMLKE